MLNTILNAQFSRFAAVGTVGFFVDGIVLVLLIAMDWSLFSARIGSFSCAVSVTWYLNRTWTFNKIGVDKIRFVKQYGYYLTSQIIGISINIGTFFLVIYWFPTARSQPLIALAMGSAVAMGFNYILAKKFVYTNEP